MRLFIYGFGPYRRFKNNITEKIIRALPDGRGLKKVVFPVRFDRGQFIRAVKRHRPDVILGLGQCSRGNRLRLEQRAVNRRRVDKRERPKAIVPGGARSLSVNLKLNGGRQAAVSYHAGEYVCNYSMYVVLDYLKRDGRSARFGFIHVPHHYETAKAVRFLSRVVGQIAPLKRGRD